MLEVFQDDGVDLKAANDLHATSGRAVPGQAIAADPAKAKKGSTRPGSPVRTIC